MGSGLKKIIRLFVPPQWALRFKRSKYLKQFDGKNLKLELGCEISNAQFGMDNFLGANVSFQNSGLGDYSYINSNTKIRNTEIGKFCSIGPNVQIVLGLHPVNLVSTHPVFYANNKPFATFSDTNHVDEYKSVKIGNDVWIAEGVLIPGGVTIGDGAVITARAVVTKDVEPYSIVGGIPAKHIKYRFDSETIQTLLESKWWNWSKEKLVANQKHFLEISAFRKLSTEYLHYEQTV
jgi:acetyltransferase-like isoleucine patch superfamily enzyme